MRGRDIKKYSYEFADLWLINTGYDIDVPNRYPAIYRHLKEIGDKFEEENKNKKTKSKGLYKREDQGQNWWNLRACTYMHLSSNHPLFSYHK